MVDYANKYDFPKPTFIDLIKFETDDNMEDAFILHYKNGSNSNVWQNEDYNDKKIWEIMNDEVQHFQELAEAMRILDPDHLTVREKDRDPFPPDVSDLGVTVKTIGYQEHEPISQTTRRS